MLNAEFDPDLIDIADSSDEDVTSTNRLPPQREFVNADVVKNRDC